MGESVEGDAGARARSDSKEPPWRIDPYPGGVRIAGTLRTREAPAIADAVRLATGGEKRVELDFTNVERVDGGVIAVVRADLTGRNVQVTARGGERFQPLFDLYADSRPSTIGKRRPESIATQMGRATVQEAAEVRNGLGFLGETAVAVGRAARQPGAMHWRELPALIESAGADALPIVLAVNFLMGFVVAYMSAQALGLFGANLFVADLIAIAMTRQIGPLMTAFVVSGRSGAGFATELGSMKVAEEIDALRTLGLEPYGWLVLPRVLALMIVLPLLTLVGEVIGIVGGWLVAVLSLGLTTREFLSETRGSLTLWDIESGLWMSLAFGLAIGLIACQQGFAAGGGAQGVGRRTTRTVVASLLATVLLDALFTIIYRVFGLS
jgi:phospholipid/cholesterol/gamma-HCH transport system permease protein